MFRRCVRRRHQLRNVLRCSSLAEQEPYITLLETTPLENLESLLEDEPNVFIPASTYGNLLRKCAAARALQPGKKLHQHIVRNRMIHDRLLANLLVFFYGKCGEVDEACAVFEQITYPNMFSWTVLITAFAQNGHCMKALQAFRFMDLEGVKADSFTLSAVLEACANHRALEEGRLIHSAVCSEGLEMDQIVQTNLLNMYGKCGSLDNAKLVFQDMKEKSLVAWNVMISAYAQNEDGREAIRLWKQMHLEGFKPDKVSFVTFVDACANVAALHEGELAHSQILSQGHDSNRVVSNTLVNMYAKCGELDTARNILERMVNKDVVSWNSMISGYVLHARHSEAFELFKMMDLEGVEPTKVTFVATLDACTEWEQVKHIHESVVESGLEVDDVLGRALINAYRCCGSLDDVKTVFEDVVSRHGNNILLWNGILSAFCEQGPYSIQLFRRMQLGGVKTDKLTMISTLEACVTSSSLKDGRLVHACVVELGLEDNMFVQTALVHMYGKCGKVEEARSLFESMKVKDSVTWNAMLATYSQRGCTREAIELFLIMDLEGEKVDLLTLSRVLDSCGSSESLTLAREVHAEAITWHGTVDVNLGNTLLNVYGIRCKALAEAVDLFDKMAEKNDVSFNTMMAVHALHGGDRECLITFYQMQLQGFKPTNISYVSVLDSCTNLTALSSGKAIHASLMTSGIQLDIITETALVNLYGKCGSLETAWRLFQSMENEKDFVCWNAVIAAYAQHGHGERTLKLFRQMQQDGLRPDTISFLVTMTACSHAGFLDEALELFISMKRDHGLVPGSAHFGCMVDLLGRSSRLTEAEELIAKLPSGIDCSPWKIFLNSCKEQGDKERGSRAAELAMNFQPKDGMPYLLLANMYAQDSDTSF